MSSFALGLVLMAALLHATWNALVKASGDRGMTLAMIALGHVAFGAVLAFFAPLPGWQAVPWIAASTVIHWGYYWAIYHGYRLGDLSLVYPISRGMAPMLVALGAFLVLGETVDTSGWVGIGAISGGVLLLAAGSIRRGVDPRAVMLGTALGFIIASYSVVDGTGARLAESSLAYVAWLFLCEGFVGAWLLWRRRRDMGRVGPRSWAIGLAGGVASALAYGLAIHAKTIAPVALVSAVRETSVVIAALIGTMLFGERPLLPRLLASCIVLAGILVIGLG
jgi:drug/metabolite transporter (DMT)-like permease